MASVTFKRGTRAEIEATAKQDGQILMETDQNKKNKMYIDLPDGSRVLIGNSGEAIDTSYDNTTSGLDATNVQSAIDEVVEDINTLNSTISNKNSLKYEQDYSNSLLQLIENTPINTVKTYYIDHTNQFTDWNTQKTYLDYASVTIYRFSSAVCNVVMVGYGATTFKCEILKAICINNNFYWGD